MPESSVSIQKGLYMVYVPIYENSKGHLRILYHICLQVHCRRGVSQMLSYSFFFAFHPLRQKIQRIEMFNFEFYMLSLMGHVLSVIARKFFHIQRVQKFSSVALIV